MKKFSFYTSLVLTLALIAIVNFSFAQEYDDIYFRKKDRVKIEKNKNLPDFDEDQSDAEIDTNEVEFDKTTNPDYLAYNSDITENNEDVYFEDGYESKTNNSYIEDYQNNADVVVKHYYYGYPSTTYYSSFDDVFWSDPFLYQGTVFDPFYDPYYRNSAYYRPGWNISFGVGGGFYGGNRWRNNYYNSYYSGYGWGGGYYNSYSSYYDPFWCPPSYYNNYRGNVIIVNNEYYGNSRGVVRGQRSTRGSIYSSSNSSSRSTNSRISNVDNGRGNTNGRISSDNKTIDSRNNGSRVSRSSVDQNNYSDFQRSSSGASTYPSRRDNTSAPEVGTLPSNGDVRRSSTNVSPSTSRTNDSYRNSSNGNNSSRSRSNSNVGSSSRSSSSGSSYSGSSRSSGSNSSRSSSTRSSSGSSRKSSGSSSGRKID